MPCGDEINVYKHKARLFFLCRLLGLWCFSCVLWMNRIGGSGMDIRSKARVSRYSVFFTLFLVWLICFCFGLYRHSQDQWLIHQSFPSGTTTDQAPVRPLEMTVKSFYSMFFHHVYIQQVIWNKNISYLNLDFVSFIVLRLYSVIRSGEATTFWWCVMLTRRPVIQFRPTRGITLLRSSATLKLPLRSLGINSPLLLIGLFSA